MRYIGHLAKHDPLHQFLEYEILPQLGYGGPELRFRVFRLGEQDPVYLYEERHSGLRVVGKFFAPPFQIGDWRTQAKMDREYNNLNTLRGYGLVGYPHHIVRPLGRNAWLSSVLVEEHAGGTLFSQFIEDAIHKGRRDELYGKLTALAYFLATLHNRTANGLGVNFFDDCAMLDRLAQQLRQKRFLSTAQERDLYWLRDRWAEQPRMWEDQQVFVHGDATPANFIFGDGLQVTAIDLERMRRADRVFDVGRVAGELQHAFMQATDNKYAAEPFIGHFLWEYACHFPDRERAFASICGRVPFQMALTLLRIARNHWISDYHRQRLISEAFVTLRTV